MIRAILLSKDELRSGGIELLEQSRSDQSSRLWLDIEGGTREEASQLLLDLGCDPLAIKDALRDRHPPKMEEFDQNTFVLFRGITSLENNLELVPQQLALFVSDNALISYHQGSSVSISQYWQQVQSDPLLLADPSRLVLKILHFACGSYLTAILEFEDRLGVLEEELLSGNSETAMRELISYRSRLRFLLRIFKYHLRMAEEMIKATETHMSSDDDHSHHERRDLYDRCERLHSLSAMYYEICGDLLDSHISISSHRLNNTMKVLTIVTAIFVPLSFLAGLYGMNFDYMPELGFKYSYFILLGIMASVATGMLLLFRKLKWL